MDYFYLVFAIVMFVLFIMQFVFRKRYDDNEELYRIKPGMSNNVLGFFMILLIVVFLGRGISSAINNGFEATEGLQTVFWVLLMLVQLGSLPKGFAISQDGITSVAYNNAVLRKYSWEEIPSIIEVKDGKVKLITYVGKSRNTIYGKLDEDNNELINFIKEKTELVT